MRERGGEDEEVAAGEEGVDSVVWSSGLGAGLDVGGEGAPGLEDGVIGQVGRLGEEVIFLAEDYEFCLGCRKGLRDVQAKMSSR